jgi:flagellar biosynthesis/type III secretory pathway chaperone
MMALDPSALARLLAVEASSLDALLGVLNREQAALATANADDLEELAPEKSKLLDDVGQSVWARDALLGAHGFDAGDDGMQAAKARDPAVGLHCDALWEQILVQVAECQEINRINGAILHRLATRNAGLLSALLGSEAPSSPYGRG